MLGAQATSRTQSVWCISFSSSFQVFSESKNLRNKYDLIANHEKRTEIRHTSKFLRDYRNHQTQVSSLAWIDVGVVGPIEIQKCLVQWILH